MTQTPDEMPARLMEIIEDFQLSEGREKLELLLQYAEQMPALPDWLQQDRSQKDFVPECMTPVYVHAELEAGRMNFYFDVPEESPTVRGYAALIGAGLSGATPEQVLSVPGDFYQQMGLDRVLSHQRLNGITAILAHMKRLAVDALGK
jgi:cysteine desulfuration protein SufE